MPRAGTALQAGKLLKLQPWLLSICHMAISDASARMAQGSGSYAAPAPDSEEDGDAESSPTAASDALLVALVALPRLAPLQVTC